MFQTKPIGDGGGMHGATCLVDSVGDIRTSEIEVLKGTDNASIEMRIVGKRGARGGARRRTRCGKWFAMFHFQQFEDIEGIVSLSKCETVSVFLKFNSEESRGGSEVFEAEMVFKGGNEGVDLRERGTKDENVIDINEKVERTGSGIVERRIGLGTMKAELEKLPS